LEWGDRDGDKTRKNVDRRGRKKNEGGRFSSFFAKEKRSGLESVCKCCFVFNLGLRRFGIGDGLSKVGVEKGRREGPFVGWAKS